MLTRARPLDRPTDNVSQSTKPINQIAITDDTSFYVALGFIAALVAGGLVLGVKTDIFRDTKTPAFIRYAKNSHVFKEATRIRNTILKPSDEITKLQAYDTTYQEADKAT